jgi:hypothetical protein
MVFSAGLPELAKFPTFLCCLQAHRSASIVRIEHLEPEHCITLQKQDCTDSAIRSLISNLAPSIAPPVNTQLRTRDGVVTLSETSPISAIEQQAKWLKSHASAFTVIGEFRSI